MNYENNVNVVTKEQCCGCHACYNICPSNAIEMIMDSEGFLYPKVSIEKCVNCGKCIKSCPGIKSPEINPLDKAYACFAKDREEHMSSSSGGFFAILARMILKENGVICGAAFDNSMQVNHIITDSSIGLDKIKKTKYVQSVIGQVYSQIEKILKTGRMVLFSGTPCQVAGLKLFLGKDYDNLVCIDLICHGVPSPKVFSRYLSEKSENHKIVAMTFRNKKNGVHNSILDYWLDNGEKISETYEESPYIKGFNQNFFIRPSCFNCKYKGIKRCSDITIGDFWGIDEFHPNFSDSYGTSAVILHSEKGIQMFEKVKDELHFVEATSREIGAWNPCLYKPVEKNMKRTNFFEKLKYETIAEVVIELQDHSRKKSQVKIVHTILQYIKRVLSSK